MDAMKIQKKLAILCDTREKKNQHLLKVWEKKSIRYKNHKLDVGDYSFEFDKKSFEKIIAIERKNSLDELCGNFTKYRERFRREFTRASKDKTLVILLIENSSYDDIIKHNYHSKMHPNALLGSIRAWRERYDIYVVFSEKEASAAYILDIFNRYIKKNVIKQYIDI